MEKELQQSFVNHTTLTLSAIAAILFLGGNLISQSPSPTPFWGNVQDLREIKFGETVVRTNSTPGAYHGYQLTLEAGTSVECNVGDHEILVGMSVVIPDKEYPVPGNKVPEPPDALDIGRINSSDEGLVEPVVIVADKTGKYIIRAIFNRKGKYSISCGMPHPTTERDRQYARAEKLFLEIRAAIGGGSKPMWTVRDKIEERAAIYRSLGDKKSLALSLNEVGRLYSEVGESDKALSNFREALQLFESLNSPVDVDTNLGLIGGIYEPMGDYQNAIKYLNERLELGRVTGSKGREAWALFGLALIYRLADEETARGYYEQALQAQRSINPRTPDSLFGETSCLMRLGDLYRGVVYRSNGDEIPTDSYSSRTPQDRQRALEFYLRAREAHQKTNGPPGAVLRAIGNTYKELGNYPTALDYLNRSHYAFLAVQNRVNLGAVQVTLDIGRVYVASGEFRKGLEFFEQGFPLLKEVDPTGPEVIAKDYFTAGETRKALDMFGEVLNIYRQRQELPSMAKILYEIACIERDLGNFNNARTRIEECLQIAESVRAKMTDLDLRTIYFSAVKGYYDFYIELLMQAHKTQPEKGFNALALQTSEKARSRGLLDLLTLSGVDIKQGIDPALLAREKSVRAELARKANQQSRLLIAKHTDGEASKMALEVSNLTTEYADVQAEIRNKSPRYAALTQPVSLETKQIQALLDSGTILLEYSLGEKKSYLWAVAPTSISSFEMPGREEIETRARNVYGLLTARNLQIKGEPDEQRRSRIKLAEAEYPKAAATLTEMLLGPAADLISNKRLLIVPDGALNYISFSALPMPKSQEPKTVAAASLGVYHEVVTLPSASTLARLREESASRKPAAKMVAIFADPVFNPGDNRTGADPRQKQAIADNKSQNLAQSRDFERAVSDVGLSAKETGGLPRLPFSRREADAIFSASPKALSVKDVDFNASKQQVFNSELDQYRIVHFATHGLLDSQHPELSGIVLSLVDKNGGDIDGFLRLQDIYNLKLNADLVVLSACNTALGKEVKGEGLIGLTRGFMYAGAPRVVASLWKVDDAATAELMSIFYRKMLTDNLRPAAALRAAQTEMMKQPRWRSPYYWAPFVLQGEWK